MEIEEELRLMEKEMGWVKQHMDNIRRMLAKEPMPAETESTREYVPENQLELFENISSQDI